MKPAQTTFAVACLWIAALTPLAVAQDDWRLHRDERFGMQISYPASLFDTVEEHEEGVTIVGPDARLDMSGRAVPGLTDASQIRAMVEEAEGYSDVTYSPGGNRWLVISGYRGDDIFYEKFFISGDDLLGFSLQYPVSLRDLYDPVVERMEDSFRVHRR